MKIIQLINQSINFRTWFRYTDEAQKLIREKLPYENIKRSITYWRSINKKKEDKIEPRKRRKPKKYLTKDQDIKKEST